MGVIERLREDYDEMEMSPFFLLSTGDIEELKELAKSWLPGTFGWQTVAKLPMPEEYASRIGEGHVFLNDVDVKGILDAADGDTRVLPPDYVSKKDEFLWLGDED